MKKTLNVRIDPLVYQGIEDYQNFIYHASGFKPPFTWCLEELLKQALWVNENFELVPKKVELNDENC